MFTTGNQERDQMYREKISSIGAGVTFETLVAAMPADFGAEAEEYEAFLAQSFTGAAPPPAGTDLTSAPMFDKTPDGQHSLVPSKSLENIEAPRAAEVEASGNDVAPQPEILLTSAEANQAALSAQNKLTEAQVTARRAKEAAAKARAVLAAAIAEWRDGAPPYTQEMLLRDHLRSEQEKRKARIEGGGAQMPAPRVGRSYIDKAAAYGRDASPEGHVRSRMQNGGSHRGAFPSSQKYQMNYDPKRGPVAKPPGAKA